MLTFPQRLIAAAILGAALTAVLYWIDSDPAYPDIWHTVREFCILTVFITFPIMLGLTWFVRRRNSAA